METVKCVKCGKEKQVESLFTYFPNRCDCGGEMQDKIHYPSTILFCVVFFIINPLWLMWVSGFNYDFNDPIIFMWTFFKLISTGFFILALNMFSFEIVLYKGDTEKMERDRINDMIHNDPYFKNIGRD